jgi:hypothetical protein
VKDETRERGLVVSRAHEVVQALPLIDNVYTCLRCRLRGSLQAMFRDSETRCQPHAEFASSGWRDECEPPAWRAGAACENREEGGVRDMDFDEVKRLLGVELEYEIVSIEVEDLLCEGSQYVLRQFTVVANLGKRHPEIVHRGSMYCVVCITERLMATLDAPGLAKFIADETRESFQLGVNRAFEDLNCV